MHCETKDQSFGTPIRGVSNCFKEYFIQLSAQSPQWRERKEKMRFVVKYDVVSWIDSSELAGIKVSE